MKIRPLWIGVGALVIIGAAMLMHHSSADKWTQADVEQLCHLRWMDQPKRYDICVGRHKGKIGHEKTPQDAQEIATGVDPHARKPQPKQTMAPAQLPPLSVAPGVPAITPNQPAQPGQPTTDEPKGPPATGASITIDQKQ